MDSGTGIEQARLLRRGELLEAATVAWNVVDGIVAVVAGALASSVALIGFGVDSFGRVVRRHQPRRLLQEPHARTDRNTERDALPDAPNEFYSWLHGQGELVDLRVVPDRCAALLLEAQATCALAAEGHEVFGSWPGVLCPGRAWLGDTPWWGRDWCNRRVAGGAIQWLYSLREFLIAMWDGRAEQHAAARRAA
jgi:hypothetical protein